MVSRSSAGTRPAESALRLSNEQAAEIEAIVRVENVPRAEKGTRALGGDRLSPLQSGGRGSRLRGVLGAGDGNRTHVNSLEGCRTTIVLRPLWCYCLVARRGFEPLISGLKGRRPSPLDERARRVDCARNTCRSVRTCTAYLMVGGEGFEPPTSSMSSWRSSN